MLCGDDEGMLCGHGEGDDEGMLCGHDEGDDEGTLCGHDEGDIVLWGEPEVQARALALKSQSLARWSMVTK